VPSDAMTDPTEGGRLHHDQQARKSHRRVSLCCGAGMQPTLTLTSHAGEGLLPISMRDRGVCPSLQS